MIDFASPQAVERAAWRGGIFYVEPICSSLKLLLEPEEEARRIKGEKDSLAKKRKDT